MSKASWSKHYQSAWRERSQDYSLPLWLRIASLAYGTHSANGHSEFAAGEIAQRIETVNKSTGEIRNPVRQEVQRAIKEAVAYGFLSSRSGSLCLVVPPHTVAGGMGSEHEPCATHGPGLARLDAAS